MADAAGNAAPLITGNRVAALAAIALMVSPFLYKWYWANRPPAACRMAIEAKLKAPSTYKTVSVDGSGAFYDIEYDAENAFGVPMRGKGFCTVNDDGTATWVELGMR
ncbi:MAG TPA: hypothetical protein VJQ77_05945 [Novosphingobium sp.]|nr:hypothetical protein [Novosphingobium sp.]